MKSVLFTKPKPVTFDCLRFLVEQGEEILGIVLYDKQNYTNSTFSRFCSEKHIKIYDFSEADDFFAKHQNEIEMIYCNTFPQKIKSSWINLAQIAAINFHSAPLPEYKGPFGYNFALLNHEAEYGVSCHFLVDKFDEGDIIEVLRFPYDAKNGTVKGLVELSNDFLFQLFQKTYLRFKSGEKVTGSHQTGGRYYSREEFERQKQVLPGEDQAKILDKIRAFWYPPFDGAYMMVNGQKIMLVIEDDYKLMVQEKQNI